ncbi:hypothetical protein ZIOFF_051637 [Zingiber officinale]|uniref:Uncharacterized protein n=1 Tax=Zingiber officinale TaxID=94328 RepID=A0A8J5FJ20_ZINOF|nr:hypothetical protein ZIOFF_051637 [Zingiber officinale]
MQMMGAAWRRWRTEVKATSYDSNTPLEELVAIQPILHGLTPQTWEVLCNYWKSTESQENGRKPSCIEIQQLSRRSRKKEDAAIDDEAIQIENLIKEAVDCLLQDKPEGTQLLEVHEEAFWYPSGSVVNHFYRYPSDLALSHEPPVSFTAYVGFSVTNIRNSFEPVQ